MLELPGTLRHRAAGPVVRRASTGPRGLRRGTYRLRGQWTRSTHHCWRRAGGRTSRRWISRTCGPTRAWTGRRGCRTWSRRGRRRRRSDTRLLRHDGAPGLERWCGRRRLAWFFDPQADAGRHEPTRNGSWPCGHWRGLLPRSVGRGRVDDRFGSRGVCGSGVRRFFHYSGGRGLHHWRFDHRFFSN